MDQVDTSSVWDLHTQKNINRTEAAQWWAAHFIFSRYRNTCSVSSMLEALDWPTLERRCQISRLSMLYKILSILVHCPGLKSKLSPLPLTSAKVMTGSSVDFCIKGLLPINPRNPPPLRPIPIPPELALVDANGALGQTPGQVSRCQNDQPFDCGPSTWRRRGRRMSDIVREFVPCTRALQTEIPLSSVFGFEHW